jgi:hypothetical protein
VKKVECDKSWQSGLKEWNVQEFHATKGPQQSGTLEIKRQVNSTYPLPIPAFKFLVACLLLP